MMGSKLRFYATNVPLNINVFKKIIVIFLVIYFFIHLYLSHLYSRNASIEGWYPETSRNMSLYLQPTVNTTKIHPWKICQTDDNILLLIVVITSPNHFEERQTIRETYGNTTAFNYPMFKKMHQYSNGEYVKIDRERYKIYVHPSQKDTQTPIENLNYLVKVVFLIGQTNNMDVQNQVLKENDLNHDILQEDFVDSYNNLTIKSSMMLKWVTSHCLKNVKFVMKLDDDTFLNLPNLMQILLGGSVPVYEASLYLYSSKKSTHYENLLPYTESLILGLIHLRHHPVADPNVKTYTPRYLFEGNEFPTYLSGPGYVMSIDVIKKLYTTAITMPFFHMEDIYITGLCAQAARIYPRHNPLFHFLKLKDKCAIKGLILESNLKSNEIRNTYNFVTSDTTCS